jgi:thiol-disulfide isomerase/thioredoxin
MKNNLKHTLFAISLLITCSVVQVFAQTAVRPGQASAEEIKKVKTAAEANPDSLDAFNAYIYAVGLYNPLLTAQYKIWAKKYPRNVNIPLAFGTAYCQAEMPQAKEYLRKAAAIDPRNANVWFMLAVDAARRGQHNLSVQYMRKATLVSPSDANYAFSYLYAFANTDPNYPQKVFDFVKRFPDSERGAQALYWLAHGTKKLSEKISYFEALRKLYPVQKFGATNDGMTDLADIYLQTDPKKALILINEMPDDKDWQLRKQIAESLIRIDQLEQEQNYNDAIIILNQVKLPVYNHIKDFIALKKAALLGNAGNAKAAYDSVAVKFAKLPTDQLDTALHLYGKKTGKDKEQIAKDIDSLRNKTSVAAYPFSLDLYTGNGKLNLKDLRGKVVLLTFWFPGCGPCGEEFPHFQAVINKFKPADVAYIGINVEPEQDPYVLPFLKNYKYSFIPLRGNEEFALKNYHVRAEPGNLVIDKDGKIIFKNFLINDANQRTLELMISSLVQKKEQSN